MAAAERCDIEAAEYDGVISRPRLQGIKSRIAMVIFGERARGAGVPGATGSSLKRRPRLQAARRCSICWLSLPPLIVIRRGFMVSGTSRTKSILSNPPSNEAFLT
jgi:hypothetical protein